MMELCSLRRTVAYESVDVDQQTQDLDEPENVELDDPSKPTNNEGDHLTSSKSQASVELCSSTQHLPSTAIYAARRWIYLTHLSSQFSETSWSFAVVLFLAALTDDESILLISSFYVTTYATVLLFGAKTGSFVDHTDRLRAARICVGTEKISILLAVSACCWVLKTEDNMSPQSIILLVAIHILGSLAMLFNLSFVVALERDWIVVLSTSNQQDRSQEFQSVELNAQFAAVQQESFLSNTNVALRQIYLLCKVVAPTFAGWIIGESSDSSAINLQSAAILVGALSTVSLVVEYVGISRIYHLIPALSLPRRLQEQAELRTRDSAEAEWKDEDELNASIYHKNHSSFGIYWDQPIMCAGISLAFINANALCFGGAMTTFLLYEGMPVEQVGFWRGLSSSLGLLGTFVFQLSTRCTTVVNTGAWSIVYLFVCLSLACSSFLLEVSSVSIHLLIAGTAAARIGFWVFDISITLLYQEMVPDGVRGRIGGVQQSLNSFFTILSGSLGIFFRKSENFYLIALVGYGCVAIATALYIFGVICRRR